MRRNCGRLNGCGITAERERRYLQRQRLHPDAGRRTSRWWNSSALSERVTRLVFGWLLDRGADFDLLHQCVRKAAHFGIFAVEGCLMGMALLNGLKRRTAVLLTGIGCALLSVLNELHQMQAAGRTCRLSDMAIDFCGALTGLAAAAAILHAFSAFRRRMAKKYDDDR